MHPHLLDRPAIPSYGVMILLGLVAAWWLTRRRARHAGIEPSHVDLLTPITAAAGLAGAFGLGQLAPVTMGDGRTHGRVLYGALLAGTGTVIAYALLARIPLGRVGDVLAPSLAVGITFGRVGCFLAGCC